MVRPAWRERKRRVKNGRLNSWGREARVRHLSPQEFHAAIFFPCGLLTFSLDRLSETWTTYSLPSGWLESCLEVDLLTFEGGDF